VLSGDQAGSDAPGRRRPRPPEPKHCEWGSAEYGWEPSERVKDPLDGGLLRSDKQVAYPIREMIPIMLIEEGIPTAGLL